MEELAINNFDHEENCVRFSKRVEKQWEKEKLLITSNFAFSHSGLKRLVLKKCENKGLIGKGLYKHQNHLHFTRC